MGSLRLSWFQKKGVIFPVPLNWKDSSCNFSAGNMDGLVLYARLNFSSHSRNKFSRRLLQAGTQLISDRIKKIRLLLVKTDKKARTLFECTQNSAIIKCSWLDSYSRVAQIKKSYVFIKIVMVIYTYLKLKKHKISKCTKYS